MKILMVSMPSLHFFRWTEQLKDSELEVYWFDAVGGGEKVERLNWVTQFVGWKNKWNYPGRYLIKLKYPKLYNWIQKFNEREITKEFEKIIKEVKPDIVHSFALYISCAPILKIMLKHSSIKWIYSSWGSDLFYFKNISSHLKDIKQVLPRINYLFTDCLRDFTIAQKMGFNGKFLGVFPGGGGFDIEKMNNLSKPISLRNIILVKGYEGRSGRAINVLKALSRLQSELQYFEIVVFGADKEVFLYCSKNKIGTWKNFKIYENIDRKKLLKLMGESLIYIGNSNSDGIPNSLLEAVCLGAFPIQSNPGQVTEEVIINYKNGLLIENCENIEEIKLLILKTLSNTKLIEKAFKMNQQKIKQKFKRRIIQRNVLLKYEDIVNNIIKMKH